MSDIVAQNSIVSYYNEHTKFKLKDFIKVNPRIAQAWITLCKNAPQSPKRILEIGCGIGSICAKMNKKWPNAKITGIDISQQSIATASKLFANNKVDFRVSLLYPETFNEQFDLIVLMDVYEHIAVTDRYTVHSALKKILNNKGKIFLSVPTPQNLKWSLKYKPETMQPVDEHISFDVVGKLAGDTETEVQQYQLKNIWNTGDYAHIVLEKNNDFEAAFFSNKPVTFFERVYRILNKCKNKITQPFRRFLVFKKLEY